MALVLRLVPFVGGGGCLGTLVHPHGRRGCQADNSPCVSFNVQPTHGPRHHAAVSERPQRRSDRAE
jgi:hypothetical protein